jgi:hypothetical protein
MGAELLASTLALVRMRDEEGLTWPQIGKRFGIDSDAARGRYRRYYATLPVDEQVEREGKHRVVEGDINNPRIQSLLSLAEVNLDHWQPTKAVVNRWGSADNYQAKCWLKYDESVDRNRKTMDYVLKTIRDQAAEIEWPEMDYQPVEDPHMAEISLFDIHLGKRSWMDQVDGEYNLQFGEARFKDALLDLLYQCQMYSIEEIVFPVGNDLLHFDGKHYTTTAGTRMDTAGLYHEVFRRAHELMSWTIRGLAEVAPVKVIIIPGNHDEMAMWHLGEVLAAEFSSCPYVDVDNRTMPRKYYQYGDNLLGFTHGHREKWEGLPLIMANEMPHAWAATRFHEWHLGHRHNKRQQSFITHDQYRTCGVRILPSLCGNDDWHFKEGYQHLPQAEAHVWSKQQGHRATFTHTTERGKHGVIGIA